MYNILIVDDEQIERNGIKLLIQKFKIDLGISEASNGEEALKYLKNNKIDILFTDVKMPFMDGLELSKYAKNLYPKIKIIIFSGFGEFEYAKTAIGLGVSDYILKPIDVDEFQNVLKKVINEIDVQIKQEQNHIISLNHEKQYILFNLLNGTPKEKIIINPNLLDNIDFIDKYSRILLIEFEQSFFEKFDDDFLNTLSFIKQDFDYINLNFYQGVLLYKQDVDFLSVSQKIYNVIYEHYKIKCYIAISRKFKGSKDMATEFSMTEECLENKYFLPNIHIFSLDNKYNQNIEGGGVDKNLMDIIHKDIENKDKHSLKMHVEILCQSYKFQNKYSYLYVMFVFSNILKEIYKSNPKYNEIDLSRGIEKIYKSNNIDNIINILMEAANNFNDDENSIKEIELVKKYIYNNYDKDLSLKELADYVYLTPNYLCYIFKRETGFGINKFIKSYRMEKAKYLLESTNMKILNISNSVGYTNVSYFCHSFHSHYGISPEKYRKKED